MPKINEESGFDSSYPDIMDVEPVSYDSEDLQDYQVTADNALELKMLAENQIQFLRDYTYELLQNIKVDDIKGFVFVTMPSETYCKEVLDIIAGWKFSMERIATYNQFSLPEDLQEELNGVAEVAETENQMLVTMTSMWQDCMVSASLDNSEWVERTEI